MRMTSDVCLLWDYDSKKGTLFLPSIVQAEGLWRGKGLERDSPHSHRQRNINLLEWGKREVVLFVFLLLLLLLLCGE